MNEQAERYHVVLEPIVRGVVVHKYLNDSAKGRILVSPPCWIERMFGKTFEKRLRAERDRCQRMCDRLNARMEESERVCEAVKGK